MGEALKDEFGDAAFDVFDAWYQRHDRYDKSEAKWAWRSFGRGGGKNAGIGTLIWEAKRGGWKIKARHNAKQTNDELVIRAAEREARRQAAREAEAQDQEEAAAKAAEIWAAGLPADGHPYLERKGVKAYGLKRASQWAIEAAPRDDGHPRKIIIDDALLVPIWSTPGKLSSLQAIFPGKDNPIRRDKDYLRNGRKQGCYHVIGTIGPDTIVVVVCEGYATGASLFEAYGAPVLVAFDAGNLLAVAEMVRARLPKATIVLAADNDQFKPDKGNPGVEFATAAAKAVNGIVAVPQFASLDGEPTDFNDLHKLSGLAIVRAQIEVAINPPPAVNEVVEVNGEIVTPPPAEPPALLTTLGHDCSEWFRVLGYDHETYYFMSHESRQLVICTKGDFGDIGLLELAPLEWWETEFTSKTGFDKKMAVNWLIRCCREHGIYDPRRVRGRGAWIDNGRIVYHHGEKLSVDGAYTPFDKITSRYVYELARPLPEPHEEMLSGDWGEWLLDLCGGFSWTMPGSAALLAGWIALAPVCGALRWRPHVWITGGAGSGKSTILNEFIHPLLGGVDIFVQGNSSEAGIRQTLGVDAIPVVFDETESNEESDARRIQAVLSLIRQASTESQAQTLKGTAGGDAMAFHVRSMFCLASIQVAIKHQADIERLSVLALRSKRDDADPVATWERIKARLAQLAREPEIAAKLFRRSLNLLPVTLKSIGVFSTAFSERFGSVRDGDQYGTMLAGAWSLISDRVATPEEAFEMIDRYDWEEHREKHDQDDSQRAMTYLLEQRIRLTGGIEATVNELIRNAAGKKCDDAQINIGVIAADTILQRYGMRLTSDNRQLLLSNDSLALRDLMSNTPFAADVRGVLLRMPEATRYPKAVRFNGSVSRCISVPLGQVLDDREEI